ncbi:MAG: LuxR C-terminal-related transcriptional regulator [Pseudomonadota bacterium]
MNRDHHPPSFPDVAGLLSDAVAGHTMQRLRTPDGSYRYSYVSDGVREALGLDPDVLMNAEAVDHRWLHPDDKGRFIEALEKSAATLGRFDEEVRVESPKGGYKWVRSIGSPRKAGDGTVIWDGVALDITDRREAIDALQKALSQVRANETSETRFSHIAASDVSQRLKELETAIDDLPETMDVASDVKARFADFRRALSAARDLVDHGDGQQSDQPVSFNLPASERELQRLTVKQKQVLAVMSRGFSNQQIAAELGITTGTVKLHISAILKRLELRNRTEAALVWNEARQAIGQT